MTSSNHLDVDHINDFLGKIEESERNKQRKRLLLCCEIRALPDYLRCLGFSCRSRVIDRASLVGLRDMHIKYSLCHAAS